LTCSSWCSGPEKEIKVVMECRRPGGRRIQSPELELS
jgi:hypothetical protein